MSKDFKEIKSSSEARLELLKGVDILADAVQVTLGPRGKNVIIERDDQSPIVTKDGVTVAKSINLRDKFKNLGVQLVKEVASRTNDVAGDGTTTATVLSRSLFKEGHKAIEMGFSPVEIKRGIDKAVAVVIEDLKNSASEVSNDEEVCQIATISANGDREIGELISRAVQQVGRDGVVTVEEAKGFNSTLETVEGMRFNRGFISPFFVSNHDRMVFEAEDPYILVTNKTITSVKDILPILEKIVKEGKPLLIIADEIEGEALHALTINKAKGIINCCAIRAPGFGDHRKEILEDIISLTGGKLVSSATGLSLEDVTLDDLGKCKKVITTRSETTLVEGLGFKEDLEKRISSLRATLEEDSSLEKIEIDLMKERLSKLVGGVAILKVGGATEVELKERKDRVEDALNATRAALQEGIVPGGGIALVRSSKSLTALKKKNLSDGEIMGINIVETSCRAPLEQISRNAGQEPLIVLQHVLKTTQKNKGYDADSGEVVDMIEKGIIDPVKVTRTALENAASVAGLMLTVDSAIVNDTLDLHEES